VRQVCVLASQGTNSTARKVGQIIARGDRRWLIRAYLGRNHETLKGNITIEPCRVPCGTGQAYLIRKLRERYLGRDLEGPAVRG
jgi:hypothetical protein